MSSHLISGRCGVVNKRYATIKPLKQRRVSRFLQSSVNCCLQTTKLIANLDVGELIQNINPLNDIYSSMAFLVNLTHSSTYDDGFKIAVIVLGSIVTLKSLLNNKRSIIVRNVPSVYYPEALEAYFSTRPVQVVQRQIEVMVLAVQFLSMLLFDWQLGRINAHMGSRALQLRQIVEELGPAYVKVAQMMSTRVDMLPQPYLEELQKLQDSVRPFGSQEAIQAVEKDLRCGSRVFKDVQWESPIASASLGQVYKGKVVHPVTGVISNVAIKVQRPEVLDSVALDVFLMRRILSMFSMLPIVHDDWVLVMDDWATRFFQEMDYRLEAAHTMQFANDMASLDGIKVPKVLEEFSGQKVLTTEWMEGDKLSKSDASDTKQLCRTLLNCYLIQLLETGFLHADPHPGNLLRTPDGYICILDFGLMTYVTPQQRIALVEYIIHLTLEDWEAVANDLIRLGFMPDGMPIEDFQQMVPIVKEVMNKLVAGGGVGRSGINITQLAEELESTASKYRIVIPPYFALILRAFSTIEGIALSVDSKYSIVNECFPYLSRRLLTDNDTNMKQALQKMLCGNGQRVKPERVRKLVNGFTSFTTSGQTSEQSSEEFNKTSKEVLRLVFAKESSPLQKLLVEELVAVIDALSKEAVREALDLFLASATTMAYAIEALGPARHMFLPLPQPHQMLSTIRPKVELSYEDQQSLLTIQMFIEMLEGMQDVGQMGKKAIYTVTEIAPIVPDLLPGIKASLKMFLRELVRRYAQRIADDLAIVE